MRRDSINRNIIKEPITTKNADNYQVEPTLREELIADRTDRSI